MSRFGSTATTVVRLVRCAAPLLLLACMSYVLPAQASKSQDARCKPGSRAPGCADKSTSAVPPATNSGDAKLPASAADFAFPIEDSRHGADAEGSPSTPQQPLPGHGKLPEMPTGDVPDPPAASQQPMRLPPGGYSSSSGSDEPAAGASSSRAADDDDVAPTAASPDAPVKASALKDLGSRADSSTARAKLELTRVEDDLKVGRFYMKGGNTQGAYLRFKDAFSHAPDDPEVRFNLAESAMALNKREEAVQNYQEALRLDPGGDHDRAARKALNKLGAGQP